MKKTAKQTADLALSYVGASQGSADHKLFVKTFNSVKPNGEVAKLSYPWCDIFVSAILIMAGYTLKDVPLSMSCTKSMNLAKQLGIWQEDESVKPQLGWLVIYDWQDGSSYAKTDNHGDPEHIGMVYKVDSEHVYVVEGNKGADHVVGKRAVPINGRYLRGYVKIRYAAQDPAHYDGKYPSLKLKKSTAQAIDDMATWAEWIADDNTFHYGHGKRAHHNGCYFCGTNVDHGARSKAGIVGYKKTYCCNPFVGAAWAHGGGDPEALKLCKKGSSWDYHKGRGYDTSSKFKKLGKPSIKKLRKGDVLCRDTHVAVYIGNGRIAHAAHEDDNVRNSKSWDSSIKVQKLTPAVYKKFTRVYRYKGTVKVENRAIRYGEVSYRVKRAQMYLNWYFGEKVVATDGIYGKYTRKYVKLFQNEQGLKETGNVGKKTIAQMKKVVR